MEKRDGVRKALNEIEDQYIDEAGASKMEENEDEDRKPSAVKSYPWLQFMLAAAGVLLILGIGTIQLMKRREQAADPGQSAENDNSSESVYRPEGTSVPAESDSSPESVYIPEETSVPEKSNSDSGNEEPIVLEIFSQTASFQGIQEGWFADILKEKFNVVIEIVADPDGSRMSAGMENGDLGDIVIWGGQFEDYKAAVAKGYLLDWNQNDLLSTYGADIKEYLGTALEYNAEANGGVVYGFTGSAAVDGSASRDGLIYTWDIRWDLYEALGEPVINDLEDYIALMRAMKELEPVNDNGDETYALSVWSDWDDDMIMYVRALVRAYFGYDGWGIGFYDVKTGEVYGVLEEEGPYYTALRFMNQLYREGLLDPDSRTQNYDDMVGKMKNGSCFFSVFQYAGQDIYNTSEHIAENKMMCSLIPNEAAPLIGGVSLTGMGYEWSIAAQTEYPELCMQIINWLATPEGALTYWYGPQGGCWDYDADGGLYLTEFGYKCQTDHMGSDMSEIGYSGTYSSGSLQINANIWSTSSFIPNDSNGQSFLYTLWDSMQQEPSCDTEASWRAYTGETLSVQYLMNNKNAVYAPYTGVNFVNPKGTSGTYSKWSQVTNTEWSQVTDIIVNGSWDCIYADTEEEFKQLWAQMTADAKGCGYDECIAYTEEQAAARHEAEERLEK